MVIAARRESPTRHLVRIEAMGVVRSLGTNAWPRPPPLPKLIRQTKLREDRMHFNLVLPLLAKDLHDPAHGLVPGIVPLFQRQEHLVPFRGATEVAAGMKKSVWMRWSEGLPNP